MHDEYIKPSHHWSFAKKKTIKLVAISIENLYVIQKHKNFIVTSQKNSCVKFLFYTENLK